jgi:hypothetical protein
MSGAELAELRQTVAQLQESVSSHERRIAALVTCFEVIGLNAMQKTGDEISDGLTQPRHLRLVKDAR